MNGATVVVVQAVVVEISMWVLGCTNRRRRRAQHVRFGVADEVGLLVGERCGGVVVVVVGAEK